MTKIGLAIALIFSLSGYVKSQDIDSSKCICDSIMKTKIESRVMYALVDRMVNRLIAPVNITCEVGRFSIDIIVNRKGQVISAEFQTKSSSPVSDKFKYDLLNAAMTSKFTSNNEAPSKQKGNITYDFMTKKPNK